MSATARLFSRSLTGCDPSVLEPCGIEDVDLFVVTSEWVHENATRRGGWTADQLAVLGVAWPPAKGWLSRLVGTTITCHRKRQFEEAHRKRMAWLSVNAPLWHRGEIRDVQ